MKSQRKGVPTYGTTIAEVGPAWVTFALTSITRVLQPTWMTIDAYGIAGNPEQEQARQRLLELSPRHGGAGVKVDPSSPQQVAWFSIWAPCSAGVDVGMSGPHELLVEILDAEWIGVALTGSERRATEIVLDDRIWRQK